MSGMWPCGQQSPEPVNLDSLASRVWQQRSPGPPLTSARLSLDQAWGISTSGVMILTYRSGSWGPPLSKHISSHIVLGVHILVRNITLCIFCDSALTSAAWNVCQFTNLSHPAWCIAHHYSVSLVYERFVFLEEDMWELLSLMLLGADCLSVSGFMVRRTSKDRSLTITE